MALAPSECCLCGPAEAEPVAVGEDFAWRTSADLFLAVRCSGCGLIYLDPAPAPGEYDRIRPAPVGAGNEPGAGALEEAAGESRLRKSIGNLPAGARVLTLDGGRLDDHDLPRAGYDAVLFPGVLEEAVDPIATLATVARLLKPTGYVVVAVHNTRSASFRVFGGRHWVGYDFPRRRRLVNRAQLRDLAGRAGLEVATLQAVPYPAAWTASARRLLEDWEAPAWMLRIAGLLEPLALIAVAGLERLAAARGAASLLVARLRLAGAEGPHLR